MCYYWIFQGLGFLGRERTKLLKARVYVFASPRVLSSWDKDGRVLCFYLPDQGLDLISTPRTDGKESRIEIQSAKLIHISWKLMLLLLAFRSFFYFVDCMQWLKLCSSFYYLWLKLWSFYFLPFCFNSIYFNTDSWWVV